jgi:glycosyltransferase involved in cell wall biosynthesis
VKRNIQMTYYDFADLNYASFFLAGLHWHAENGALEFTVSKRQPDVLKRMPEGKQWQDILFSILLFKVSCAGEAFHFCIDTRDSNATGGTGKGFHLPLLKQVRFYFKVNYNRQRIEADSVLARHAHKIIPLAPFFPTRLPKMRPYVPSLFSTASVDLRGLVARMRQLRILSSLEDPRTFRKRPKVRDVFFMVGYYERHDLENEFRYQIISELRARPNISAHVGFVGRNLPGKYRELQIDRELPLYEYLSEIASSRIALYTRGVHDCLSFKFGQLLAMGMPMVGQSILNNRDELMANPYFDTQFAYENPWEIVDRVEQLLDTPEELGRIGDSNAAVFDFKYTPEKVVRELLAFLSGVESNLSRNPQSTVAWNA